MNDIEELLLTLKWLTDMFDDVENNAAIDRELVDLMRASIHRLIDLCQAVTCSL